MISPHPKTFTTFFAIIYYCLTRNQVETRVLYPILLACEEELKHYPKRILYENLDYYLDNIPDGPIMKESKRSLLATFISTLPDINNSELYEKESTRKSAKNSFYTVTAI